MLIFSNKNFDKYDFLQDINECSVLVSLKSNFNCFSYLAEVLYIKTKVHRFNISVINSNFMCLNTWKAVISGVFRTVSNSYDWLFCKSSERLIAFNYFHKKLMSDNVLNTSLYRDIFPHVFAWSAMKLHLYIHYPWSPQTR